VPTALILAETRHESFQSQMPTSCLPERRRLCLPVSMGVRDGRIVLTGFVGGGFRCSDIIERRLVSS